MDEPRKALPARWATVRTTAAFSLIEISLALAIIAFAFVAMLGLLAPGLTNFSAAMNTQTSAEIFQRIAADLQDADFDSVIDKTYPRSGQFFQAPLRYYDLQGQEVRVQNPASPTDAEKKRIIYTARIRGSEPGALDPKSHKSANFTSLPDVNGGRFNPRDLTIVTVQIALTRGREINSFIDSTSYLIKPDVASKSGVSLRTYSLMIARNGY